MASQFANPCSGAASTHSDVLNEDGSVTRTVTLTGIPLTYDFSGDSNVSLTADFQITFHIPNTVDATTLGFDGPMKYGIANDWSAAVWGGEFDVPAQFA